MNVTVSSSKRRNADCRRNKIGWNRKNNEICRLRRRGESLKRRIGLDVSAKSKNEKCRKIRR